MTTDAYLPLVTLTTEQQHAAEHGMLITASDRLRREYSYAYDHGRMVAGEKAWRAPAIAGFDAVLRREHESAAASFTECPRLLGAVDEHALVRTCAPAGLAHLAPLFQDAWQQVNAWQLDLTHDTFSRSENSRQFVAWANTLQNALRTDNLLTSAQLSSYEYPPEIAARLAADQRSGELRLIGFDVVSRSQQLWLDRRTALGAKLVVESLAAEEASASQVGAANSCARRFSSSVAELTAAIHWARGKLEHAPRDQPLPRIGIVVPDLLQRHATAQRLLHSLLDSGFDDTSSGNLYNLGGGLPLASHPLVASALKLLASIHEPTHFTALQTLLADPALPAINTMNRLPPQCAEFLCLADIPTDACPESLRVIIRSLKGWSGPDAPNRSMREWWLAAASVLRNARWHNSRNDSEGYQATNALLALLVEQAPAAGFGPDSVGADQVAWPEAFSLLQSVAGQTLFAPAGAPAPVQVLGYLEALELEFDQLWITGMDETAWPTPVVRNPLLPPRLLTDAGAPRSNYAAELQFAQRWLQRVTASPAELQVSFVLEESSEDSAAQPLAGISPLLRHRPPATSAPATDEAEPAPGFHPLLDQWAAADVQLTETSDRNGTPPIPPRLTKGARRLENQAACPMRGWALHQLDLEAPLVPHDLPDAMERGTTIHSAAEALFAEIDSNKALAELSTAQEKLLCNNAAQRAVNSSLARFSKPVRTLEAERIAQQLMEFLTLERKRDEFYVNARELPATATIGPFELSLRLDRVDDIPGGQIVIDYKSTSPSVARLLDDRLSAPQIPLYVLLLMADGKPVGELEFSDPLVTGGAFAQLKTDNAKYVGVRATNTTKGMPDKLNDGQDWSWLLARWRDQLLALSTEIADGLAIAAPTRDACSRCDLHALCRFHLNHD